jgi:hypothetical protein
LGCSKHLFDFGSAAVELDEVEDLDVDLFGDDEMKRF